jgi:lysophospholipid acyltransferase (LPLAT)-like uncharacterized protein
MNPPRRPVGAVVVPHQPTFLQRCIARLVWLSAHALAATQRPTFHDPFNTLATIAQGPVIFAVWHNRLALSMLTHRSIVGHHQPARRLAALVSASRDGALLAAILETFHIQPVRGSSSRRGSQAFLELTTWARRGLDIAITPDGPRGPRYVAHPGVIALARLSGLPIVPISFNLRHKRELSSWDRFQIPIPFCPYQLELGEILRVSAETDRPIEADQAELQKRLMAITRD